MHKNILALQFQPVLGNKEANYQKVESMLAAFAEKGLGQIDFLVLPEVWSIGWDTGIFAKWAEHEVSKTEAFLVKIAKEYRCNVIGGSYIRQNRSWLMKNTCKVIGRDGKVLGKYDKLYLFAPDGETKVLERGNYGAIVSLEGLRIGLSLCYDIRFPELFRAYAKDYSGAPHLLINMAAWPKARTEQYTTLAKARAIENQAYFLGLSQCGQIKDNIYTSGNSLLVNPMGETVKQLGEDEGFIYAAIDTQNVDEIREKWPNLQAISERPIEVREIEG